jgi:hypothetical protein
MTVARIPNVNSLLAGDGRPKRPLGVLLGSAGDWQLQATRELGDSFGGLLRTDVAVMGASGYPAGSFRRELAPNHYLDVLIEVMFSGDVVVVWLDVGPFWAWAELGMALVTERLEVIAGADPSASFYESGHLRFLMNRAQLPTYNTLEETIAAARQAALNRRA